MHRWVLPHFTWRRALLGGVLAFVALAGAVGLYIAVKKPGSLLAGRAAADEAGVGIAVLPFSVTGGTEMDVWREGMLDLLATNLDGVGGLRTIDPRTIMARLRELDATDPTAELPRLLEAGRRSGARYALLGSVVTLGPSVRLSAELHDLEGGTVVARAQRQGRQDDILTHVDELSVEIMRGLLARADGPLPGLRSGADGVITSSLDAMKAFLEGESLYRESRMEEAVAAYQRAVTADSTFALAYWALSWAWAWRESSDSEPSMDALTRALAMEQRLPTRIAAIARADFLRRRGRLESIPMLREAVGRYPDDAEARYLFAEALFHLGDQAVLPLELSEDAFLRAIELDPSTAPFYYHVLPVAIARGDTSRAVALMERFARSGADTTRLHQFHLTYQLLYGDDDQRDAVARDLVESGTIGGTVSILLGASQMAIGVQQNAAALRGMEDLFSRAVAAGSLPDRARVRLRLLFQLGRHAEALEILAGKPRNSGARSEGFPFAAVLYYGAHFEGASIPEALVLELAARESAEANGEFFGAAYAAETGDWPGLASGIERIERRAGTLSPADSIEARLLAGAREALVGLRQWKRDGQRADAVATLERVRATATSMWDIDLILQNAIVRSWLADLYLELDRPEDAERYLKSLWLPSTDYRLAVLYEREGRREDARRHYAAFLDTWRDADPGLSRYDHARAALEGLSREP